MLHLESYDQFWKKFKEVASPVSVHKRFWEFVEKVDWKNWSYVGGLGLINSNNRLNAKEFLLKEVAPHFTFKELRFFEKDYEKLEVFLRKRFEHVADQCDVSDDGWWDLLSSVIGYGKDHFYEISKDKSGKSLIKQALKRDYQENFSYIFQELDQHGFASEWRKHQ